MQLTDAELHEFLAGPWICRMGTLTEDGAPCVTPLWYEYDGSGYLLIGRERSAWLDHIRRDPRVSLCVDDERPPFAYVLIEGTATLSDDLDELRRWAARIAGRYMGADLAESYGQRNGVPGELLVKVRPTKVVSDLDVTG